MNPPISRREAILCVSAMLGGAAFTGGSGLLDACERTSHGVRESSLGEFTAQDVAFLDEIAETILPATKTPGAKAAKTGAFMALMVTDSYSHAERDIFCDGMRRVEKAARKALGVSFMQATPPQRTALLATLDREQKRAMDAREAAATIEHPAPAHYFRMMKELALLGYFTSEIGCTQATRYIETPGRFDPCIPYAAGDPAWAAHA